MQNYKNKDFIRSQMPADHQRLLTAAAVREMKTAHASKLLQSWLNFNHYTGLVELMEEEVGKAPAQHVMRAKAYIEHRKTKGEAAGLPDNEIASVANSFMNLETQRDNVNRAKMEIDFYVDVITALGNLSVGKSPLQRLFHFIKGIFIA